MGGIDKLIDLLNGCIPVLGKTDLLNKYISALSLSLIEMCNSYKKFALFFDYKLSLGKTSERSIITEETYSQRVFESMPEDLQVCSSVFNDILLPLSKFDYSIPLSDNGLAQILQLRDKIEDNRSGIPSEGRFILGILTYKSNFLIRRITQKPFSWKGRKIIPRKLNLSAYDQFINKTSLKEDEIPQAIENLRHTDDFRLKDVIVIATSCQGIASSKSKEYLNKLIEIYNEFYEDQTIDYCTKFNLFSYHSVLNFIYNCKLCLTLKRSDVRLNDIKEDINHIANIQHKTGIQNYYPFTIAIEKIISCIESHIAMKEIHEILMVNKFSTLSYLIAKSQKCIEWSANHYFVPFQLSDKESSININGLEVFVPCSFAKVIDYDNVRDKVRGYKSSVENLKQKVDLETTINSIDYFKDEIKKSEKKSMELMVAFTGAITLLFGSVNIFASNKTDNIGILIANTAVMGLYVMLFCSIVLLCLPYFSRAPFEKNKNFTSPRFWILLIFSAAQIITLYFCYNNFKIDTPEKTNKENIAPKSDQISEKDSINLIQRINKQNSFQIQKKG